MAKKVLDKRLLDELKKACYVFDGNHFRRMVFDCFKNWNQGTYEELFFQPVEAQNFCSRIRRHLDSVPLVTKVTVCTVSDYTILKALAYAFKTSKTPSVNRKQKLITLKGETRTAAEWSKFSGTPKPTILKRLSMGWKPGDAIYGKKHVGR